MKPSSDSPHRLRLHTNEGPNEDVYIPKRGSKGNPLSRRRVLGMVPVVALGGLAAYLLASNSDKPEIQKRTDEAQEYIKLEPIAGPSLPEGLKDIPTIKFEENEGVDIGESFYAVTPNKTFLFKYVGREVNEKGEANLLRIYDPLKLKEFTLELSPDLEGGYTGALNLEGRLYKISTPLGAEQPFLFDANGDGKSDGVIDTHFLLHTIVKGDTLTGLISPLFYKCKTPLASDRGFSNALVHLMKINGLQNPDHLGAGDVLIIDLEALAFCADGTDIKLPIYKN